MDRRAFLVGAFAGAALVSAGLPTPPGEWVIHWRDYMPIPNRLVQIGFWQAGRRGSDRILVSTTFGVVRWTDELEVIDTTLHPGWPYRLDATAKELKVAKELARTALMAKLATQTSWPSGG